ncbi:MAG: hypothetical protein AB7G93_07075 [Bdellovibrionales bacterium]
MPSGSGFSDGFSPPGEVPAITVSDPLLDSSDVVGEADEKDERVQPVFASPTAQKINATLKQIF